MMEQMPLMEFHHVFQEPSTLDTEASVPFLDGFNFIQSYSTFIDFVKHP